MATHNAESVLPEDLEDEDEHGIRATFVQETVTYYRRGTVSRKVEKYDGGTPREEGAQDGAVESCWHPVEVLVWCATTTTGGALTSAEHDATGILIWPATHLLCQHLVQRRDGDDLDVDGMAVVELGCGVGLAGVTALRSTDVRLWASTDVDERSLTLCRRNYRLNGFDVVSDAEGGRSSRAAARAWVESLAWGDAERATQLLEQLQERSGKERFDTVVGADIVYPSTSGQALQHLFETVDRLLRQGGTFWLSFATRDGARTPLRLLTAASEAGFAVDRSDPLLDPQVVRLLPPLLDAVLLKLRRKADAADHNAQLGGADCHVFSRLRDARRRLEDPSSDEEWEAPFGGDDADVYAEKGL